VLDLAVNEKDCARVLFNFDSGHGESELQRAFAPVVCIFRQAVGNLYLPDSIAPLILIYLSIKYVSLIEDVPLLTFKILECHVADVMRAILNQTINAP
jgi:hypothetical protein